jgi:hypothetical protein
MDKPYFASLAEKALQADAAQNVLSKLQGEVATLLAQWGYKPAQPGLPRRASDVRDDLQEVLNQALAARSGNLADKAQSSHGAPARTLMVQVDALESRLDRIEQIVAKIEGTLGDWGWGEQATYLCKKHEPEQKFTGARNWPAFLGPARATRDRDPKEARHSLRQQALNRLNDVKALVDSYTPLMARRLAADLTAHDRIDEIFQKYGFERAGPDDEKRLIHILEGSSFPEKMNPNEFKGWPRAAVGGSFAQELATALDYMPSTWALERELAIQGMVGPGSAGQGLAVSGAGGQGGVPGNVGPTNTSPKDTAWKAGLMGLAFSGGGIRSATFNLGILQGLAKLGLLRRFNYLSTVSGGGYIGSWLINWIKQDGVGEVERRLCPDFSPDPRDLRLEPIRFLRDFSNYLTPQMGLLSADMWVMAVVWVRNTLLNLLILLPAIFAVLLVPRVPEVWAQAVAPLPLTTPGSALPDCNLPAGYLWALVLLVLWIVVLVGLNLRQFPPNVGGAAAAPVNTRQRFYSRPWGVLTFIVLPILAAGWLASLELWCHAGDSGVWEWTRVGVFGSFMAGILLVNANYFRCFRATHGGGLTTNARSVAAMVIIAMTLGVVIALLTMGLEAIFSFWRRRSHLWHVPASAAVTVFGIPLVVLALFVALILLVGFMSRNLPDGASKWLVRMRAYIAIYSTLWLAWAAISIYGSWLDYQIRSLWYAKLTLITAWIWTTIRGVLAGKSPDTKGSKADWKTSLGFYATVGPYVFIIGLFLALSLASQSAVTAMTHFLKTTSLVHSCLVMMLPIAVTGHEWLWSVLFCLGSAALLAFWLSFWFDVNEFSLNNFYRGRLVRCYLGATNKKRRPNPFTGFDPTDERWTLSEFKKNGPNPKYEGPFPVFNATLNLVHGDELAWQERRGASFTFTPDLCGYETPWHAPANPQPFAKLEFLGYRETNDYAYPAPGMHVGTPMSISGAALSPNMGFYTRAATGFLMTIFNARLGWWLGNPRHKLTRHRAGPTQGLAYLMKELLGLTNDRAGFIYVSDGGHFENLAIYELVRRRCRFIVACDAEEDAAFAFNGLGNAIRKCREDLGVEIDLRVDLIKPETTAQLSRTHCVVGTIKYPDQVGLGYIVYLKTSLVGDEPEDVLQYHVAHRDFPHQSTGDQWFTESQFESYRRLGLHIATSTFQRAVEDQQAQIANPNYSQLLFEELRDNWYPPVKAIQKNFTRHAQALDDLVKELRSSNSSLVELDTLLIPVLGADSPVIAEQDKPKAFLFLSSVIQLMENIYLDLEMEANADHPHCAGWIQIFQSWSEKPLFQEAWHRYSWSYGRNFRRFCTRRFGLPYLEVSATLTGPSPKKSSDRNGAG